MAQGYVMSDDATMPCHNCDIVSKRIMDEKRATGSTWREMAAKKPYFPIPPGTLCAIAKGRPIPQKWYRKLGIRKTTPREPRVTIRLDQPGVAAATIRKHGSAEFVAELARMLINKE